MYWIRKGWSMPRATRASATRSGVHSCPQAADAGSAGPSWNSVKVMKLTAMRSRIREPDRRSMNLVIVLVAGRPVVPGGPRLLLDEARLALDADDREVDAAEEVAHLGVADVGADHAVGVAADERNDRVRLQGLAEFLGPLPAQFL